jgi:hypothetical protein
MTVIQIQKALRPYKKVSLTRTRVYIKKYGIYHLGPRQRPQLYPEDSAERILRGLGLFNGKQAA